MNKPELERCPGPWTAVLMTSHKSRAYGATYYKVVDKNRNNVCCYITDKKTAELIADTWNRRAPLPDNNALTVEQKRREGCELCTRECNTCFWGEIMTDRARCERCEAASEWEPAHAYCSNCGRDLRGESHND